MSTTPSNKLRSWPDLSMYGLHFGVIDMPSGEKRLVMVDKEASWATLARQMGFQSSRWHGVWVRQDLKFNIPRFAEMFPRGKVIQISDEDIQKQIRVPLLERRSMRLSQMGGKSPAARRLSWHPSRVQQKPVAKSLSAGGHAERTPAADEAPQANISADVAIRQTAYLGMNHLSQEVFESGDGMRFTKSGDVVIAREAELGGPSFLRVSANNEADTLVCAAGLVNELDAGRTLHADDFERYLRAMHGSDALEDSDLAGSFQKAIDQSLLDFVGRVPGLGRDAFNNALRLHEGRPSYWRAAGTLPTPLPVGMILQSIISEHLEAGIARNVIDVTTTAKSHSWAVPGCVSVLTGDMPEHDIALGGIFGTAVSSAATMVSGVRVSRSDHMAILKSLARRSDDGISAFVIAGDRKPGNVDPETRRLISHIGARYEIKGLTDLDAHMIAPGNEISSRLLVIGAKRASIDYTFSVPSHSPVIYDYDALWNWSETMRAAGKDEMTFGDDGREVNRWQAPYIPSSQMSEPQAMSPRNMLGPVRRALARIVETEGMGIDEYVATKLHWTVEEMEQRQYLDAEQCDAVALMIYSAEKGDGFVQADATGLGKGRTLAAMMRYYRLNEVPIAFITEKSQLFRDIYRDIEDIGSLDLFQNPFILNNDIILRSVSGAELGRSPKKEALQRVLASGAFPVGHSMVMATYSQFNRKSTIKADDVKRAYDVLDEVTSGTLNRHHAIEKLAGDFSIRIADAGGAPDNDTAIASLNAFMLTIGRDIPAFVAAKEQLRIRELSDPDFLKLLRARIPTDTMGLKQSWIRSNALSGAYVALDESHNAAGPDSQTNDSMKSPVAQAVALSYSSATFAKGTRNFGLYSRIFPSTVHTESIPDILNRGGEPLQEILSAGLAEDGRMIRREHDLSNIEFKMAVDTGRRHRNEDWANSLASVLSSMSYLSGEISTIANHMNAAHSSAIQAAKMAAKAAGHADKSPSIGVQHTNFSSRFYNVSRAFMMAMNADLSADLAIKALREGRKPVITVENTIETVLSDLLAESIVDAEPGDDPESRADSEFSLPAVGGRAATLNPASLDPLAGIANGVGSLQAADLMDPLSDIAEVEAVGLVAPARPRSKRAESYDMGRRLSFKDILHKYADNLFYAWEVERVGSKVLSRKRLDLKTPELEDGIKAVYELIEAMPDVPLSPIDIVRDRIGREGFSIDELSGRKLRIVDNGDGTDSIAKLGERNKSGLIDKFNDGDLDAIVLSKSGSTGISLHASSKFIDQSQRELIEMQPAADIATRIQFWGRVNRKGQVTPPIIHMVSSGLPGEKRLMTMQNAKLRKLSANISGNADNSAIAENAPDILNRIGNEVCFRWLEGNPKVAKLLGVDLGDMDENDPTVKYGTKWVDSLTGKIMMLSVDMQTRVYAEIETEFHALIEQYELEGRNPLKSGEFDIKAKKTQTAIFEVSPTADSSVFSAPVMVSEIEYLVTAQGLDPDALRAEAKAGREQLHAAWGGINWLENVKNLIDIECDIALPLLLSHRHATIEAALSDPGQNGLKNYANRASSIKSMLSVVTPGSFLRMGSIYVGSESMYVIGLDIPKRQDRINSASEYKVRMRNATTRKVVSIALSSLHNMGSITTPELSFGSKQYQEYEPDLMEAFKGDKQWVLNKVILEGNLFRAAMIADKNKFGQAVTFTNEKGMWQHAILLPSTTDYKNAKALPVDISTPEMLTAILTEHDAISIGNNFRSEEQIYSITKCLGKIEINLFKGSDKTSWILNSDTIKTTLTKPIEGSRVLRGGHVNMAMLPEFCEAFVKAAGGAKAQVCVSGTYRDWSIDFAQRQREAALSASEVAAKASLAGANIEDELAAMGI